jgi:hypothetical protein
MNEAAILAARRDLKEISKEEIADALERIIAGGCQITSLQDTRATNMAACTAAVVPLDTVPSQMCLFPGRCHTHATCPVPSPPFFQFKYIVFLLFFPSLEAR